MSVGLGEVYDGDFSCRFLSPFTPHRKVWNGFEWSSVECLFSYGFDTYLRIEFLVEKTNGTKLGVIECTMDHPFIMEDGKRLLARELEVGFRLREWKHQFYKNDVINTVFNIETVLYEDCPIKFVSLKEEKSRSCVVNDILVGTN